MAYIINWLIIGLIIFLFLVWLRKCFRTTVSTKTKKPAQAVVTRWGKSKAVNAVKSGLHFVVWPIENLVLFPTHLYELNIKASEIHSKKTEDCATAVMTVDVTIYFRWAQIGNKYQMGGNTVNGKELLMKTFYALPASPEDAEELKDFVEDGVIDAVRRIMTQKSHRECREKKPEIEREIKKYLLEEPGNPFRECAIPSEYLDVAITSVKFTEEMEKAFSEPEVKEREKEAQQKILDMFIKSGIDPMVAGMLTKPPDGKGMSMEQLRDLMIFKVLAKEKEE